MENWLIILGEQNYFRDLGSKGKILVGAEEIILRNLRSMH